MNFDVVAGGRNTANGVGMNECWFFPHVVHKKPTNELPIRERTSNILNMNIPEERRDILESIALSYVESDSAKLSGLSKPIIYAMDNTALQFFTAMCMNMATIRNSEI